MTYKILPGDPRPTFGESNVSEQVEYVFNLDDPIATHQTAVNDFLITLREDTNHIAVIRSVRTETKIGVPATKLLFVTTIHYALIGTDDPPFIL